MFELRRLDDTLWEIPASARGDMRVPARVFADREILDAIRDDRSLEQLQNVATLPGIVEAAIAMPDIHQGYGFPVGALAATAEPDGVVSPGGVGYDINCGVRLLAAPFSVDELGDRRRALVQEIARSVPAGAGREGSLGVEGLSLEEVLRKGPRTLLESLGIGTEEDLELTESRGCIAGADPASVSERALARGSGQLGTLGSGNHFIELQRVDRIFDEQAATAYGLTKGQVTVLIHSGSRGLGHQVCTDYVKRMDAALASHAIKLPDRQLSCAPLSSADGRAYLGAMAAAANFGLGEPSGDRSSDPRIGRQGCGEGSSRYDETGLRRRTQRGEAGRARRTVALRSSQGRHPGIRARIEGCPVRVQRRRAAGLHPRKHGNKQLRAGGPGRSARAFLCDCLPWGGAGFEPDERAQAGSGG
jgi:hypothetical protein